MTTSNIVGKDTVQEKLIEIQGKLNVPKSNKNTFGGYNYRSCEDILEAVKPLLGDCLLVITDEIVLIGDRYYVKATATLSLNGDSISGVAYARESEKKTGMDESQITGAASSYARKYALNGLLLIDDVKDADTQDNRGVTKAGNIPMSQRSKEPTIIGEETAYSCKDCGVGISDKIASFSNKKFGRPLCMNCQKKN